MADQWDLQQMPDSALGTSGTQLQTRADLQQMLQSALSTFDNQLQGRADSSAAGDAGLRRGGGVHGSICLVSCSGHPMAARSSTRSSVGDGALGRTATSVIHFDTSRKMAQKQQQQQQQQQQQHQRQQQKERRRQRQQRWQQRLQQQIQASSAARETRELPPDVHTAVQDLEREIAHYCSAEAYRDMVQQRLESRVCWRTASVNSQASSSTMVATLHPSLLLLLPARRAADPPLRCLSIKLSADLPYIGKQAPVWAATLALLGNVLPSLPHLKAVVLHCKLPDPDATTGASTHALFQQGAVRFLHKLAAVLAASSAPPLRHVRFELIHGRPMAPPVQLVAARDAFQATLAAAAKARRQALLMSIHSRSAAAGCLVGRLPAALLGVIMADSLPLAPCACTIEVVRPGESALP